MIQPNVTAFSSDGVRIFCAESCRKAQYPLRTKFCVIMMMPSFTVKVSVVNGKEPLDAD